MKYMRLTEEEKSRHPSIHYTGSVSGMKKWAIGESMTYVFAAEHIFIISVLFFGKEKKEYEFEVFRTRLQNLPGP